jgi:hypothetical protein
MQHVRRAFSREAAQKIARLQSPKNPTATAQALVRVMQNVARAFDAAND